MSTNDAPNGAQDRPASGTSASTNSDSVARTPSTKAETAKPSSATGTPSQSTSSNPSNEKSTSNTKAGESFDPLAGDSPPRSSEGAGPKPRIGDSRPAPADAESSNDPSSSDDENGPAKKRRRRRRNGSGGGSGDGQDNAQGEAQSGESQGNDSRGSNDASARSSESTGQNKSTNGGQAKQGGSRQGNKQARSKQNNSKQNNSKQGNAKQGNAKQGGAKQGGNRQRAKQGRGANQPIRHVVADAPVELDEKQLKRRRGRSRKGRPVGRYMMVVAKREQSTHIAIVEGRQLVEYVVSRPSDDVAQIHGNIYLGRVQNVLPGMEAAFVDIGTPKNAVLYRADVAVPGVKKSGRGKTNGPKIEEILKPRQMVLCQVTKNPIAHKGARLTMEVSLPGRFVVLVPNSDTYGISKRLPDGERKRLRQVLDKVRPDGHGIIVRTAAENVTAEEIERDVLGLKQQWEEIDQLAKRTQRAALLYREPDLSTRVIREEFNKDFRAVIIDDEKLYDDISDYVSVITPALAERVEHYDKNKEPISVFERYHVQEQLHKAVDRKVWLPSGGSLIIEATEALTVIDVNTGKNVGSSSLEETVFRNNLEAAEEVAHQLRLRDIGGIIVIDFVDMEDRKNREEVTKVFRKALARDKTRTQVFGISDLGLVEMTRKRIGEGLVESLSALCPDCSGRGLQIDQQMIEKLSQ